MHDLWILLYPDGQAEHLKFGRGHQDTVDSSLTQSCARTASQARRCWRWFVFGRGKTRAHWAITSSNSAKKTAGLGLAKPGPPIEF